MCNMLKKVPYDVISVLASNQWKKIMPSQKLWIIVRLQSEILNFKIQVCGTKI